MTGDKVWFITGCSAGLGRELAEAVLASGHRLTATARDTARLRALADRYGDRVRVIALDVTDPVAARDAVSLAVEQFGRLDVLVNNAGLLRAGGIEDIGLDGWNAMLAVNLTGYMLCAQAFGRGMLARGAGSIVHIASVAAHHPQTWSGAYSPSKAGIAMLSRQIAAEWGARGVRSNTVCPGMIRTPLSKAFYEQGDVEARRSAMTASRRIGEPRDIAEVVAFLASRRAAYVNGAELAVDGGFECMLMDLVPRPGFEAPRTA